MLSPAVCDYRHRALYLTYDIAPFLVPGQNCVALWLGRGWAAHKPYGLAHGAMAKAQLEVTLAGGQTVRVATDSTWQSHPTPITYLGNWRFDDFGGERYDATLELPGWNSADLDDSAWTPAVGVRSAGADASPPKWSSRIGASRRSGRWPSGSCRRACT